jgi:hypothetical protein
VPNRHKEDPPLSRWVYTQRKCFKNGILDQERKVRLEGIGFELSGKGKAHEMHFEKLVEFKEKHGHCKWLMVLEYFSIFFLNTPTNTSTCLST